MVRRGNKVKFMLKKNIEDLPLEDSKNHPGILKKKVLLKEDAVSMIVNGFCKEVFKELPMEFAVEAQKLLSITLEGAVG